MTYLILSDTHDDDTVSDAPYILSGGDIALSVCVDCYFEHHTGNDMRDMSVPFDAKPLGLLTADELRRLADNTGTDEDAEGYFSWSPCQGCGSSLGGDRFDMVIMDL